VDHDRKRALVFGPSPTRFDGATAAERSRIAKLFPKKWSRATFLDAISDSWVGWSLAWTDRGVDDFAEYLKKHGLTAQVKVQQPREVLYPPVKEYPGLTLVEGAGVNEVQAEWRLMCDKDNTPLEGFGFYALPRGTLVDRRYNQKVSSERFGGLFALHATTRRVWTFGRAAEGLFTAKRHERGRLVEVFTHPASRAVDYSFYVPGPARIDAVEGQTEPEAVLRAFGIPPAMMAYEGDMDVPALAVRWGPNETAAVGRKNRNAGKAKGQRRKGDTRGRGR
jgi:hypothetical protein